MAVRAEELRLDAQPLRKFLRPAIGVAAMAAVVALIRRATREPRLTPMSEQWLACQQHDSNRFDY